MTHHVKAKPDEYHTLTPSLTIHGADKAIEWYTKIFDAKVLSRTETPDGKSVWHAELRIGDSVVMLADEDPNMGGKSPKTLGGVASSIHVYTEDLDGLFARATAAGAKPLMPPTDMFWGDRFASIADPFGHVWSLATHMEDVPTAEMEERGRDWAAKMASQKP
ncbi:MAG: VOC family protein [Thermoplasmata archaeon]